MTNYQREVYVLLLLAGREDEATKYREKCEAEERKEREHENG